MKEKGDKVDGKKKTADLGFGKQYSIKNKKKSDCTQLYCKRTTEETRRVKDWIDEGGIVVYGIDICQVVGTGDTFVSLVCRHRGGEARGGAVFIAFYVPW